MMKMMNRKCHCGGAEEPEEQKESGAAPEGKELTLADLPVGSTATIVRILPKMRGSKKFADVGLVPGTELLMEAHAPFGGLLRVKIMETSMALHRDDVRQVVIKEKGKDK